jgi:hypothetical protein
MLLSYLEEVPKRKAHLPQRGRHTPLGNNRNLNMGACTHISAINLNTGACARI